MSAATTTKTRTVEGLQTYLINTITDYYTIRKRIGELILDGKEEEIKEELDKLYPCLQSWSNHCAKVEGLPQSIYDSLDVIEAIVSRIAHGALWKSITKCSTEFKEIQRELYYLKRELQMVINEKKPSHRLGSMDFIFFHTSSHGRPTTTA